MCRAEVLGRGFPRIPRIGNWGNYAQTAPREIPSPAVEEPLTIDAAWLEMVARDFHKFSSSDPQPNLECSIYRAPRAIRRLDEKAFKPKVVSIGPYHYRDPLTRYSDYCEVDMQSCKWCCLKSFVVQHKHLDPRVLLRRCLLAMKKHEERIRRCYSEEVTMESNELAEVMMLDGCFILWLLLHDDHPQQSYEPARVRVWTLARDDLLLLENQIPFFVLYELRDILVVGSDLEADLIARALDLFQNIPPLKAKGFSSATLKDKHSIHHLLHLFYLSRLPDPLTLPPGPSETLLLEWIPSATELAEFGVKFKRNRRAKSFLDIHFSRNGVMEIPALVIDDHSKNLFQNLIAFEQCYRSTGCHVAVYASFMDWIINTQQDERLLHSKGILINLMSADQDVTHFFGHLCAGVHFAKDRFYLASMFADVASYQERKWNKCWADFNRVYCSHSWAAFAGAVAFVLFVFAVAPTAAGIISHFAHK